MNARPGALRMALLGAECTGKTTLASRLHRTLSEQGWCVHRVDEVLRDWCVRNGRTPGANEQEPIALEQTARGLASGCHDILVSDTTALMTAIYSELHFGDPSLTRNAVEALRSFDLILLLAPDIPWVADGLQRDGPQQRSRFHARLCEVLEDHQLPHDLVQGQGTERMARALEQVESALRNRLAPVVAHREPNAPVGSQAVRPPGG
ncbi:MAG: ATP-binding protein [Rhodoferax sp.]|nr:ATP-binding protein [Rhodoferax sp.]